MTSSDPTFPALASEPEQRVWALREAKRVLTKAPFGGNELSTVDLIDLAMFILTGEDPHTVVKDRVV